ncbi:hypothetical protein L873DRAFT_1192352 [Choiromyces venosus 120613-1]|uniref:Uncharacterized protein n=1 Tax=Choiromyces venosus 120613-1 TaxID=1336337 RepID=A0A3N4JIV9_9PEZI|nr:hypothetical protein L873DRAFT_1192352 [Choiromyces venosus 120613-1]
MLTLHSSSNHNLLPGQVALLVSPISSLMTVSSHLRLIIGGTVLDSAWSVLGSSMRSLLLYNNATGNNNIVLIHYRMDGE